MLSFRLSILTACRAFLLLGLLTSFTGITAQLSFTSGEISRIIGQQADLRLATEDYQSLTITSQYTDERAGIHHVYVQQQFQGIPVKEGTMGLHFTENGELFHFTNHFITNLAEKTTTVVPGLTAQEALQAALTNLNMGNQRLTLNASSSGSAVEFNKGDFSVWDVPVRLVFEITEARTLALAWESRIYPLDEQNYWELSIDALTGTEIARIDRVIHCTFGEHDHNHAAEACTFTPAKEEATIPTVKNMMNTVSGANFYRVYDAPIEAPTFGERTLVRDAGDPTASPLGWHNDGITDHFITKGNNVYAYQDPGPLSTGIPSIGGLPGQQPLVFDFEADLSLPPATFRDAAITNLFYWNNKIHDIFYHYGFTEAAGNFQQENFAKGGQGLDGVLAEAQDGSGVDNANFLTLEDGLPGRMQMFLWTGVPLIDGDFDNGVILHEYGHGISTRLTGGPGATCLGGDEQSGEGWSDFFGMMITMQPETVPGIFASGRGLGSYVVGEDFDGNGIRPARYSTDLTVNDYTYADLNNAEISAPHGVGFIWATMLWEMTSKLVETYGYDNDVVFGTGGNNLALQLVMTGLTLQPCSPTFVEQRDAILAADQQLNGGTNHCLIWEAFAKRGLGFSASSGTNSRGDEIPAFDMPPSLCVPTISMKAEVASLAQDGQTTMINLLLTNNSATTITGVNVTDEIPAGTSVVSASQSFSRNGRTVRFSNLSIAPNSTETIQLELEFNTGSEATMIFRDDLEESPFAFTPTPGVNQFVWSTDDAFSGDYSWFAADPNNPSNQLLELNDAINVTPGTHLRFAHRYNTEAGFDGGRVEISTDDGSTWNDAGALFVENGYNDFVALADNPLINGFCFAGNSGGFTHSVLDLSTFNGQAVKIRFRSASDVATGAEGWYIDDLEVVTQPLTVENQATYSMANGFITGSVFNDILVLGANSSLQSDSNNLGEFTRGQFNAANLDVEIVPNPASTSVELTFSSDEKGAAQLSILNAQGQEVFRQTDVNTDGSRRNIAVSDWPAGMYIVRITQGDALTTKKMMVQ